MVTWKPPEPVNLLIRRNRDEELAVFELCMTPRLQSLYQTACDGTTNVGTNGSSVTPVMGSMDGVGVSGGMGDGPSATPQDQTALALCLALATAYRYLSVSNASGLGSDAQETSSGGSGVGHSIRNSLFARYVIRFSDFTLSASAVNISATITNTLVFFIIHFRVIRADFMSSKWMTGNRWIQEALKYKVVDTVGFLLSSLKRQFPLDVGSNTGLLLSTLSILWFHRL